MSDADIDATLRELTSDPGPRDTAHIRVGSKILGELPAYLSQTAPKTPVVVICDANTKAAAGDEVLAALEAAGHAAQPLVLEPQEGEDEVGCDDAAIERLQEQLGAREVTAIAVGAGTVNDIVKMATFKLGRPYVCVCTAASMNGYTSAIAAVLSGGVKRTLAAQQARAVFADIEVLRAAPAYLNQAGFGDLLSKPYSNADWLLSHLIRGVPFAERPAKLLDDAYRSLLQKAADVKAGGADGVATLTRTILLSGFTMAIAGTSAPASGGEHLVSHYWDMEQHCRHETLRGLHGTQVGVATRLSAMLFDRLANLTADDIDPDRSAGPDLSIEALWARHPGLTPEVVEEVRTQIETKQKRGDELRHELRDIKRRWPEILQALRPVLIPSEVMTRALKDAGAVDRPSGLGVSREHAVRTLTVCREIRNRYVGLDLMADLGVLPDWAHAAVDAAER